VEKQRDAQSADSIGGHGGVAAGRVRAPSVGRAPHRVQAAIDLGLASISVLVTWTAKRVI
jgi:hypothetical protein